MIIRPVFIFAAALPLFTTSAFGWGCDAHQVIALIARAHLTHSASNEVDQLLRDNPIDPALNRFCTDRPDDFMADSATWADDKRAAGDTADWHFIDIPLTVHADAAHQKDAMKWCEALPSGKPGCIISALEYELAILRNKRQPPAARADALRYTIHFMGDLTQPLHTVDHRGGNCTSIRFFSEAKPENLHAIWDTALVRRDIETRRSTQSQYAQFVDDAFSRDWPVWGKSKVDILAWTWESHAFASTVVYGELKPPIPAAPPAELKDQAACNVERDAVAALHISIGDEYASRALPVIREQMARAGYRLAGLLNETFP